MSFPSLSTAPRAFWEGLRLLMGGTSYVQSGFALTAQGAATMQVNVAAGVGYVNGVLVNYGGGNVIPAAGGALPRIDLIVILSGQIAPSVVAGVAGNPPTPPALPANALFLGMVFVTINAIDYTQPGAYVADYTMPNSPSRVLIGNPTLQSAEILALDKTIDVGNVNSQYGAYFTGRTTGNGGIQSYQTLRIDFLATGYSGTGLASGIEATAFSEATGNNDQKGTIAGLFIAHGANSASTSTYQTGVSGQSRWGGTVSTGVIGLGLNTDGVTPMLGARVIGVKGRGLSSGASNGMSGGVFLVGAADIAIATIVPGAALIADAMATGLDIFQGYNNGGTAVFKVLSTGRANFGSDATPITDGVGNLGNSGSLRWGTLFLKGQILASSPNTDHYFGDGTNPGFQIHAGGAAAASIGAYGPANQSLNLYSNGSGGVNIVDGGVSGTIVISTHGGALGSLGFPNVLTTASAANAFLDNAAANNLLRSTSSLRYKNRGTTMTLVEAQSLIIRWPDPFWYTSRSVADHPFRQFLGFAAEEVAAIDDRFVTRDEHGRPDWVQYERLVAPLLVVVQDQQRRIAALEERFASLPGQA
jgi:hypothetical protein